MRRPDDAARSIEILLPVDGLQSPVNPGLDVGHDCKDKDSGHGERQQAHGKHKDPVTQQRILCPVRLQQTEGT